MTSETYSEEFLKQYPTLINLRGSDLDREVLRLCGPFTPQAVTESAERFLSNQKK